MSTNLWNELFVKIFGWLLEKIGLDTDFLEEKFVEAENIFTIEKSGAEKKKFVIDLIEKIYFEKFNIKAIPDFAEKFILDKALDKGIDWAVAKWKEKFNK